jgi:OOP family OmpA-OmpF porin
VVSAPAPAAQPVKVIRITLSAKTLFDFDKSDLRPEGKRALDDVLVEVAKHSGEVTHITVTGHTDWVGTIVYNQKLSERRANAVRFYLISKGVDASMVSSVGMGKAEPIATNRTAEGRQLNRRAVVEFEIRDTEQ